jgi:hypothetical protein
MKLKIIPVILLFVVVALLYGQNGYPQLTNFVQTRPQAIPTSLTAVISQDAYICYADFTATGQNILIQDRQASAIAWLNNTLGSSGSPTTWIFKAFSDQTPHCRWFPNGISIQAGSTGVTGTMIIGCPTRCALNWGF